MGPAESKYRKENQLISRKVPLERRLGAQFSGRFFWPFRPPLLRVVGSSVLSPGTLLHPYGINPGGGMNPEDGAR